MLLQLILLHKLHKVGLCKASASLVCGGWSSKAHVVRLTEIIPCTLKRRILQAIY